MQRQIYNSTFEEVLSNNPTNTFWRGSCGSSSISSIEKNYDPAEIKKIVDDLVMSRFGFKCSEHFSKLRSRPCLGLRCEPSEFSIDTSNLSELISYQHRSVTTLNSNYRNMIKTPEEYDGFTVEETVEPESDYYAESITYESIHQNLVILNETKEQILKAIHFDHTFHGGTFVRERLEAEKLLLVTDAKIDALFSELGNTCEENSPSFCSGTLEISRIHLWPKEPYQFNQYFICLVTYGPKVYGSNISKIKSNGVISFNGKFTFSYLPTDFEIKLKIYSISTNKVFKKRAKSFTCGKIDMDVPLRQSLFSLCGETVIRLGDLDNSGTLQAKLNSGLLTAAVSTCANLNMTLSGFVNVSQNRGKNPLWNRQWSCLKGRVIKYFNYPPMDESCEGEAVDYIDLTTCKELRVASREESPRKQTLIMETKSGKKFLISCDSRYDFEFWEEYLKMAVLQLKLWEKC